MPIVEKGKVRFFSVQSQDLWPLWILPKRPVAYPWRCSVGNNASSSKKLVVFRPRPLVAPLGRRLW